MYLPNLKKVQRIVANHNELGEYVIMFHLKINKKSQLTHHNLTLYFNANMHCLRGEILFSPTVNQTCSWNYFSKQLHLRTFCN